MASSTEFSSKLDRLRKYSACDVSDALLKLQKRTPGQPARAGYLADIRPFGASSALIAEAKADRKIIAPASTLKYIDKSDDVEPLPADSKHAVPKGSHWADETEAGTILVVDQAEGQTNASVGGIMAARMKVRGVVGCVVGGRVRDMQELEEVGLPIFAQGQSTVGSGADLKVYGLNVPVTISGVDIKPGDIVFCDSIEGIVVIPSDRLDETLSLMGKLVPADDNVKDAVSQGMPVAEAFKKFRQVSSIFITALHNNKGGHISFLPEISSLLPSNISMPFSTSSWVPLEVTGVDTPTLKRGRSNSGFSFNVPAQKRTKRSLSVSDKGLIGLGVDSAIKQILIQRPPPEMFTNTVTLRDPSKAEDTPSDNSASLSEASGPVVEREASTAFSTSSGTTLLPSDVDDVMLLDHEDQIEKIELDEDKMILDTVLDSCATSEASPDPTFHKFLDLPRKLQVGILQEIVPKGQCFKPFYKAGMLKGHIVNSGWSVTTEPVTDEETSINFVMGDNHDIHKSATVSKEYADVYLETFYSSNGFAFDDPKAAMWFFKNIGKNLSYLRRLQLVLHSGFPSNTRNVHRDTEITSQSLEELWYSVLCFLQYRHKLDKLTIATFKWPTENELYRKRIRDDDVEEIVKYRKLIYHKLERIHGIKKVFIKDASYGLTDSSQGGDMAQLTLHMQQSWPAKKPADKRKTPLVDVLKASRKRLGVATDDEMTDGDASNGSDKKSATAPTARTNNGAFQALSEEDVRVVVDDVVAGTTDKSKDRALQLIAPSSQYNSEAFGGDADDCSTPTQFSATPEPGLLRNLVTSVEDASAANNEGNSTSADDIYRSPNTDSYRPSDSGRPIGNSNDRQIQLTQYRRSGSGSSFGNARRQARTYGKKTYLGNDVWDDGEQPKRE